MGKNYSFVDKSFITEHDLASMLKLSLQDFKKICETGNGPQASDINGEILYEAEAIKTWCKDIKNRFKYYEGSVFWN